MRRPASEPARSTQHIRWAPHRAFAFMWISEDIVRKRQSAPQRRPKRRGTLSKPDS